MRTRFALVALALALVACAPADEGQVQDEREAQAAAVPKMSELIAYASPLADAACASAEVDGLWCGRSIGGVRDTVYLCGGGRTYAKVDCGTTCLDGGYRQGYALNSSTLGRLSFDYCQRDKQEILISLKQQKLRACRDGQQVFEHGVSTGARGHESWNPIGMSDIYEFTIGERVLVQRMISPFGPDDYYDARVPWSMRLMANGLAPTGEFLHASGECISCGATGSAPYGVSHGCINQAYNNARKLFLWTPLHTRVHFDNADLPASGCASSNTRVGSVTSQCYSSTLEANVDKNTCVQARSDRQWYICQAGKWVSPIPVSAICSARYPLP